MKKKFYFILFLLATVLSIYIPGICSAFYYDDYANLKYLSHIQDAETFWEFVFNGHAGPLGRPLSLFTFALQSSAWPNNREILFLFNIVLHTCNAAIVFLIAKKLAEFFYGTLQKNYEFGLIAALFWALSPILASSSLILIQRMTVLSAFFLLLATLAYLNSFSFFKELNHWRKLFIQLLIIALGTVLSALSKENGVLLPALIFCIEITILNKYKKADKFRTIRKLIFGCSLLVLIIYISPLTRDWLAINDYRKFSPLQRLQGEFLILWDYIKLIFFPKIAFFGPFQDQIILRNNGWLFAASGWLAILSIAFFTKNKYPFFSLGVLWFLVGHILESSTILLEPYYEHRNYVPLLGIALLFSWVAKELIARSSAFRIAVYCYIFILAGILLTLTMLWGQPKKAADFWVETNLGSVRAVVHQVNLTLGKDQNQIEQYHKKINTLKDIHGALAIIERALNNCTDCFELQIQSLVLSCLVDSDEKVRQRFSETKNYLKKENNINITAIDATSNIGSLIANNKCNALNYDDIDHLVIEMMAQKSAQASSFILPRLEYQRATLAYASNRFDDAEHIAKEANNKYPNAQPISDFIIDLYIYREKPYLAKEFIETKLNHEIDKDMRKHLQSRLIDFQ